MKNESTPSQFTLSLVRLAKDPTWKSVIQGLGGILLVLLIVGGIFFALTGVGIPVATAEIFAVRSVVLLLKKI